MTIPHAASCHGSRAPAQRRARWRSGRPERTAGRSRGGNRSQFKKELGLTADQSARIDKIWETTRPELRQEWDELTKLEAKLSRLIQNDADEAVLTRQIDRVETARAGANKTPLADARADAEGADARSADALQRAARQMAAGTTAAVRPPDAPKPPRTLKDIVTDNERKFAE